ncbi:MAG TPA: hypothetical protein VHA57_08965, partial [Actinomycetota bacterium]|nr:hypothetical protein [Actinomycetota bacterium]
TGTGQPWQVESGGPPPLVPSFTWDYFTPFVDPAILGQATIDGVPTTIVAFYGNSGGSPAWFEVWLDARGLVRQVAMRAQGHVMDDHYLDYNGPIDIVPPAGAG